MSALQKAIEICQSQVELARQIGGKTKTGHIYYWLQNGVPPNVAPLIEAATKGAVTCEQLVPGVQWTRDKAGRVTGFHTPVARVPKRKAA